MPPLGVLMPGGPGVPTPPPPGVLMLPLQSPSQCNSQRQQQNQTVRGKQKKKKNNNQTLCGHHLVYCSKTQNQQSNCKAQEKQRMLHREETPKQKIQGKLCMQQLCFWKNKNSISCAGCLQVLHASMQ